MSAVLKGLERIPHVIEEHGWTKGQMIDHNGKVCLVGATRLAFGLDVRAGAQGREQYRREEYTKACELLRECTGNTSLLSFNDNDARTLDEVLEAVQCAIDKAKESVREVALAPALSPFIYASFKP